jgi:hypothetical protein
MKIFFTCPYSGKEQYQPYYDKIVEAIKETNNEFISPEIGNYKNILDKSDLDKLKTERQVHYEAIRKGIVWADVVIFEMSKESFQVGYEANLAIQNKKPILCMSLYEDFSEKIHNRYFYGAKYTKYNVKSTVKEFINKHQKELLSERFNFFLSKRQLNLLEDEAQKQKMSSSEYLRYLIDAKN